MPILDDFADMLPHQVIWERRLGADEYGTPTFDLPLTFSARVDYKLANFISVTGQLMAIRGTVIVGGTPTIRPEDRVTLHDGSQPPILDAAVVDDFEGVPYYTSVTFG
jgi:hypothetical protein